MRESSVTLKKLLHAWDEASIYSKESQMCPSFYGCLLADSEGQVLTGMNSITLNIMLCKQCCRYVVQAQQRSRMSLADTDEQVLSVLPVVQRAAESVSGGGPARQGGLLHQQVPEQPGRRVCCTRIEERPHPLPQLQTHPPAAGAALCHSSHIS